MAGGADIRYVITIDSAGAKASLQTWDQALKEAQGTAQKTAESHTSLWKQFAIGQLAANAVASGLRTMWGELKSTVAGAIESENASRKLELALATTGRTVSAMLPGLEKFANEIQRQTVYDDEAAKSAMALMAQLSNLDSQGLKRATEGAVGLASVFGMDLQSAATLVGKAMAGSTAALSRYGIRVSENLPLQEKQNQLLAQLGPMYERAKGQTDTFAGSLAQLGNAWGEMKEQVGGVIVQNESVKNGIKDLKEWITKLTTSDDFKLWISIIIDGLREAIELVGKFGGAIKGLTEWLANLKGKNKDFEESQIKLNAALERAAAAGHDLGNKVKEFIGPLQQSKSIANETGNAFREMGEKIKVTVVNTFAGIGNLRTRFVVLGETMVNTVAPAARYMGDVLEQAVTGKVVDSTNAFFANLKYKAKDSTDYISLLMDDIRRGFANTIKEWVSGATTFKDFLTGLWGNIKDAFFGMIGEMVAEWTMNFLKKIITSTTSALTEVATGAKNLVSSVSGILSGGLAAGIGAFAGTFLGTLLGGGKGGTGDITYWLKFIKDNTQILVNYVGDNINGMIHELVDGKNRLIDQQDWHSTLLTNIGGKIDSTNSWLSSIESNTRTLKDITSAQHGLDAVTTRRQLIMVHPQERVTISPVNVNVNPGQATFSVDGKMLATAIAPYTAQLTRDGLMKIHKNAWVER